MIQQAVAADNQRLLEVWQSAVKATHHFLADSDFEFFNTQMPIFLSQANLYKYCDRQGEIQAFMAISGDELDMLFVHNTNRGKGIGRQLLIYATDTLQVSKVDVNEQNEAAHQFYIKHGFRLVGRSPKDGFDKDYPILHLSL